MNPETQRTALQLRGATRSPILIRRTYGAAGYRKDGPYHLVGQEQLPTLADYRSYGLFKAWCGTTFRVGTAEVLPARDPGNGGLYHARLCRRCFPHARL